MRASVIFAVVSAMATTVVAIPQNAGTATCGGNTQNIQCCNTASVDTATGNLLAILGSIAKLVCTPLNVVAIPIGTNPCGASQTPQCCSASNTGILNINALQCVAVPGLS